jgi:ZIP family zinc transporter
VEGNIGTALQAAGLGAIAASALIIGALIGIYAKPKQKIVATVMAFGSGALISALALELATESFNKGKEEAAFGNEQAAFFALAIGFVGGGILYWSLNALVESRGGFLRKRATLRRFLHRRKLEATPEEHHEHVAPPTHAEVQAAAHAEHKENEGAPLAIFMGALIDGIPESVVIGSELMVGAALNPTFLIAVFISNLPEAMSSAAGMTHAGFSVRRIMGLWIGLTVASAFAAFAGNLLLAGNVTVVATVDAIAGGGILAMLASTMMPEAFEQGGPSVSISTIVGFLAAYYFHAAGGG